MQKALLLKLGGFVTALCATGALVAATVPATGAYFSDSKDGSIAATSGHLTLAIDPGTPTALSFTNLMPGTNETKNIHYGVNASAGNVDVWLTFDKDSSAYARFTGGKSSPAWLDGGLGRYGYFSVADSHGGIAFTSGNLAFADKTNTYGVAGASQCTVDANGRGGSATIFTGGDYPPYCGVPSKILLASNLPSGSDGTVSVTFGLNGLLQTIQGQNEGTLPFHLVATQAGHPLA
jgi:hypothetical protein